MIYDEEIQASQPSHSQPPVQPVPPSQTRKKNINEYDWVIAFEVDEDECFYKMTREKYKMTCTHNGLKWACTAHHHNFDDHQMEVLYYSCGSKHCIQKKEDTCPFRYCVKKCLKDDRYFIYRVSI